MSWLVVEHREEPSPGTDTSSALYAGIGTFHKVTLAWDHPSKQDSPRHTHWLPETFLPGQESLLSKLISLGETQ